MSGIYVHIPFCKQACHYCDFHFSTSLKTKEALVNALIKEIELQKNFFTDSTTINSVYLGGGTPSLLSHKELDRIFEALHEHFSISKNAEVTLEANPDDLSNEKLNELKNSPVNRLSIGVQSFFDEDLQYMNRAHNAKEAETSIVNAQAEGFEMLSIDLIYGTPSLSASNWEKNIYKAIELGIPHISAYSLTIEPNTALQKMIEKGKAEAPDDDMAAQHFETLMKALEENNYVHYEISNFCQPEKEAIHNSNYWKKQPYLGIGPSAHTFDGKSRYWNVANNKGYIDSIQKNKIPQTTEALTEKDLYNEMLLTGLRTMWGVNLKTVEQYFGKQQMISLKEQANHFTEKNLLSVSNECIRLTKKGKFMADAITSELFWV